MMRIVIVNDFSIYIYTLYISDFFFFFFFKIFWIIRFLFSRRTRRGQTTRSMRVAIINY